jgi:hypothetical protein
MRETRLHFINDRGQPTRGSHLACWLDKVRTTPVRKTKNQQVTKVTKGLGFGQISVIIFIITYSRALAIGPVPHVTR